MAKIEYQVQKTSAPGAKYRKYVDGVFVGHVTELPETTGPAGETVAAVELPDAKVPDDLEKPAPLLTNTKKGRKAPKK